MLEIVSQYYNSPLGKFLILVLCLIVIFIIRRFVKHRLIKNIQEVNNRARTYRLIDVSGYFLLIIIATLIYSNSLGNLTVALGVAGAGIAFALQEVIASVAGWLAIMIGGFYSSGDRVQLGGIKGDVVDIGVLRTTVMETGQWVDGDLYNGRIVLIANSFVFKEPVFNYSGNFPFLWDEIKIPVKYGSNYEKAKSLLLEIGKEVAGDLTEQSRLKWNEMQRKYILENAQTEPMVTIIANDNWVEFTLRYVVDYKKRRTTKSILFTKILESFEEKGNNIQFASATFELVDAPDLNVNFENKSKAE